LSHTSAPSEVDMKKGRDKKKIGEIIEKIHELGLSYKDGAERFGLKPWVLYDYNKKKSREAESAAAAVPASIEPQEQFDASRDAVGEGPVALPGDVEELIRAYRRDHPAHGFKRIQDILKGKYLVVVSRKQIRKVLKQAGLVETCDSSFDREETVVKGTRRFEASRPCRSVPTLTAIIPTGRIRGSRAAGRQSDFME
jgi:hypothetical protein